MANNRHNKVVNQRLQRLEREQSKLRAEEAVEYRSQVLVKWLDSLNTFSRFIATKLLQIRA